MNEKKIPIKLKSIKSLTQIHSAIENVYFTSRGSSKCLNSMLVILTLFRLNEHQISHHSHDMIHVNDNPYTLCLLYVYVYEFRVTCLSSKATLWSNNNNYNNNKKDDWTQKYLWMCVCVYTKLSPFPKTSKTQFSFLMTECHLLQKYVLFRSTFMYAVKWKWRWREGMRKKMFNFLR